MRLGPAHEALDNFLQLQFPPEVGEHQLVHPDGDDLGIDQDAVAVENHELETVKSHSAMVARRCLSSPGERTGSPQTMPRHR
ncbi:hypothetical protein ABIB29_002654 [Arthrobacter sp. UYEF36]